MDISRWDIAITLESVRGYQTMNTCKITICCLHNHLSWPIWQGCNLSILWLSALVGNGYVLIATDRIRSWRSILVVYGILKFRENDHHGLAQTRNEINFAINLLGYKSWTSARVKECDIQLLCRRIISSTNCNSLFYVVDLIM